MWGNCLLQFPPPLTPPPRAGDFSGAVWRASARQTALWVSPLPLQRGRGMGFQTKPPSNFGLNVENPTPNPAPQGRGLFWRGLAGVCPPNRAVGFLPPPAKGTGDGFSD